jgi:predicted transcriptional regulator
MTGDEVAVLLDLPAQSVSARINGLHKDGFIVDSGLRRNTRYGRKAIVWVVS